MSMWPGLLAYTSAIVMKRNTLGCTHFHPGIQNETHGTKPH